MNNDEIFQKARDWFQDITEADLDLMISLGAISKEKVIEMYISENNNAVHEDGSETIIVDGKEYLIGIDLSNE